MQGEGRKLIVMLTTSPHCCLIHCKKRKNAHACDHNLKHHAWTDDATQVCISMCTIHACMRQRWNGLGQAWHILVLATCWNARTCLKQAWNRLGAGPGTLNRLATGLQNAWNRFEQAWNKFGAGWNMLSTGLEQVCCCCCSCCCCCW